MQVCQNFRILKELKGFGFYDLEFQDESRLGHKPYITNTYVLIGEQYKIFIKNQTER